MLRAGGAFDGQRLLSPKTVRFMTMNHLPALLEASGAGERPAGLDIGRFVISMIQLMESPWPLRAELKALTYGALIESL